MGGGSFNLGRRRLANSPVRQIYVEQRHERTAMSRGRDLRKAELDQPLQALDVLA